MRYEKTVRCAIPLTVVLFTPVLMPVKPGGAHRHHADRSLGKTPEALEIKLFIVSLR